MSLIHSTYEATSCPRVAIYLRYSSDMSRVASLEDQERNCRRYAEDQGWSVDDDYVRSDAAKTGRTIVGRDGLKGLLAEAQEKPRPFDVLLSDEPSRLGRSLKDILGIVELLKHYGVRLVLVAKKLDSADPNFTSLLTFAGLMINKVVNILPTACVGDRRAALEKASRPVVVVSGTVASWYRTR